jgi:hypothetical protein
MWIGICHCSICDHVYCKSYIGTDIVLRHQACIMEIILAKNIKQGEKHGLIMITRKSDFL